MKTLAICIFLTFLSVSLIQAQSTDPFPQGMKYQALARDLSGEILADQNVRLRIHLKDSFEGEGYYSETHSVFTNEFGLFSLVVGQGTVQAGVFSDIPWSEGNIWIEIEIQNPEGGYETISNSKLLAIPYAFHANSASEINTPPGQVNPSWSTMGNANTNPELNFLGTTDSADLIFMTDSEERLTLTDDGRNTVMGTTDRADLIFMTEGKKRLAISGDGNNTAIGRNTVIGTTDSTDLIFMTDRINRLTLSSNSENTMLGTTDQKDLIFMTDNKKRVTITGDGENTINGQVTIVVDDTAIEQSNYKDYPLKIEGGNQGIAIKLHHDEIKRDQNFITFFNESGEALGRIEGTYPHATPALIIKAILEGADILNIKDASFNLEDTNDIATLRNTYFQNSYTQKLLESSVDIGIDAVDLITTWVVSYKTKGSIEDPVDAVFGAIKLVVKIIRYGKLLHSGKQNGVAFESGGADYAEWLEKAYPEEHIGFGEVVGIKGGLISKTFTEADQFLAITSNPTIIGAMPIGEDENNFEKVALLGQVPVLVYGEVATGDYILPSGFGDGYGIAVNPGDMKARDYCKIIGVAWSKSEDRYSYNYINTAVGFSSNQLGMVLNQMQDVINTMQMELAKLNPDYQPVYFDNAETSLENIHVSNKQIESTMLDGCGCGFSLDDDTFICYLKCMFNQLDASGIDPNGNMIRAIVKKAKPGMQLNGEDISVALEVFKIFAEENVFPTINGMKDGLFAEGGLIDLDVISSNENIPESIIDLLTGIRDGTLMDDYENIESMQNVFDDWTTRIGYLQALAWENE